MFAPLRGALGGALLTLLALPAQAQFVIAEDTMRLGIDDGVLTPDGRHVVLRDNTQQTKAIVLDADTGAVLLDEIMGGSLYSGVCQDGVAATNERAVVIGTETMILDLTTMTVLAIHDTGYRARDVAITPDGTLAAVRGGTTDSGQVGGLYIFDLASGNQVAYAPGEPPLYGISSYSSDVDSVAVTDEHAVFTSILASPSSQGAKTVVSIFELHPAGGGPPQLVYQTQTPLHLRGAPHDLAITPDGQHVAVRSELAVGLFRLAGPASRRVWGQRLWDEPGSMGNAAMDSIEVTDTRIATISRRESGGFFGAQLDLFTMDGVQKHRVLFGDPHDLAITPSGERLVVRTSEDVYLFDLVNLPVGDVITELSNQDLVSTHTSYGAGLDSVVTTDDFAVTLARFNNRTKIRFWDLRNDFLEQYASFSMMDLPSDVDLTPDGSRVVVTGLTRAMGFLLETGQVIFEHDPSPGGGFPWCDGVAVNDERAIHFGYVSTGQQGAQTFQGWYSLVDLFRSPVRYCGSTVNSSGQAARLEPFGSASVSANDLSLQVFGLPVGARGVFVKGDGQVVTPFGNGTLCVGGSTSFFGVQSVGASGTVLNHLDLGTLPGGAVVPGSTWNFQFVFRDYGAVSNDTSEAYEVLFGA